jgi:hypothetical protein
MFIRSSSGTSSHATLHTYESGYLLPVLNADELLFGHRHKGLMRQFRDLAEVSNEEFDATYGELLKHFMEFVQVLPYKPGGILGSLLNYGLARTAAVFQKYCQMKKGQTTNLLKFALFSAALLKDLGRVMSNQRVVMFTENDEPIGDWNPFSGSMISQTQFYKLYPIATDYLKIETEVTLLLARQIMPRELWMWLSRDVDIFSDWVRALLGQEGDEPMQLTAFLAMIKREDIIAVLSALDGALTQGEAPTDSADAEAFYQWLLQMIRAGKIKVNAPDSGVFITPEGVLLDKKLFKQFSDFCGRQININIVYVKFGNLMGIPKKGGEDFLHAQYFSHDEVVKTFSTFSSTAGAHAKGRTLHEGMVVDPHLIFIDKAAPTVSSLQSVKSMAAMYQQSAQAVAESIKKEMQFDKTKR